MKNHGFSTMFVRKYTLCELLITTSGIVIKEYNPIVSKTPIDEAFLNMEKEQSGLDEKCNNIPTIPIFCLTAPVPNIQRAESLFIPRIPIGINKQIVNFHLRNPRNLSLRHPTLQGIIGSTLIDVTSDRILIIGNTDEAVNYLRILCSRLSIDQRSKEDLACSINELLDRYPTFMLGTSMIIGTFGAVVSFMAGFLLNAPTPSIITLPTYILVVVLALISILFFLYEESFEDKIFVFMYDWAIRLRLAVWAVFITLIIFFAFSSVSDMIEYIIILLACTIILNLTCVVSYGGIFFSERGLTKRIMIKFRIFMIFSLVFFSLS